MINSHLLPSFPPWSFLPVLLDRKLSPLISQHFACSPHIHASLYLISTPLPHTRGKSSRDPEVPCVLRPPAIMGSHYAKNDYEVSSHSPTGMDSEKGGLPIYTTEAPAVRGETFITGDTPYAKIQRAVSKFGVEPRGIERVPEDERTDTNLTNVGTMVGFLESHDMGRLEILMWVLIVALCQHGRLLLRHRCIGHPSLPPRLCGLSSHNLLHQLPGNNTRRLLFNLRSTLWSSPDGPLSIFLRFLRRQS